MIPESGDDTKVLAAAIRSGSAWAFEEAFNRYREKVYGYFFLKTQHPEDAMDLVQNTFARLWQYRASISPEFLLEQHLFHIARTVFIDHLRREARHAKIRNLGAAARPDPVVAPDAAAEFELHHRLSQALARVPASRRRIFELSRLEGYSYREIAEMLSISVKATDNQISKAVRQIRKLLALVAAWILFH